MPGRVLTTLSTMLCPHGGSVTANSAGLGQADGGTVLTVADVCTISGCTYQLPTTPPTPSPCVLVQWVSGEGSTLGSNLPALTESSVGLCLAATGMVQGTVQVIDAQSKVMIG